MVKLFGKLVMPNVDWMNKLFQKYRPFANNNQYWKTIQLFGSVVDEIDTLKSRNPFPSESKIRMMCELNLSPSPEIIDQLIQGMQTKPSLPRGKVDICQGPGPQIPKCVLKRAFTNFYWPPKKLVCQSKMFKFSCIKTINKKINK